jgi:hypothetical protein
MHRSKRQDPAVSDEAKALIDGLTEAAQEEGRAEGEDMSRGTKQRRGWNRQDARHALMRYVSAVEQKAGGAQPADLPQAKSKAKAKGKAKAADKADESEAR